jgi:uncharacterized membrane protein
MRTTSLPTSAAKPVRSLITAALIVIDMLLIGIFPLVAVVELLASTFGEWTWTLPNALSWIASFWVWYAPMLLIFPIVAAFPTAMLTATTLVAAVGAWRGSPFWRQLLVGLVAVAQLPALLLGGLYMILHYAIKWSGQEDQTWVPFLYHPSRLLFGLGLIILNAWFLLRSQRHSLGDRE